MKPIRVAIVGGGCAGLAAAYELTKPELEGRFSVTVYQQGWRLGGKGASGRGSFGRIEEHGLHVWMGFYENAFRLIRSAYEELDRDPKTSRIATWRDAFFPAPHVGLANWTRDTDWTVWSAVFPPYPGMPGDPLGPDDANPFTVLGYLNRAAEATLALLRVAYGPPQSAGPSRPTLPYSGRSPADLAQLATNLSRASVGATTTMFGLVEQRLEVLAALLRVSPPTRVAGAATTLLTTVMELVAKLQLPDEAEQPRRRAAEVVEVLLASQRGILCDEVLAGDDGFDKLDSHDFCDWLRMNGASEQAVCSPFVRGLYSLMFAYEDGDPTRPRVAAGQMLRGCARMFFTYRGAFFWKMRSGMGDIVFAPLYEVLRRRGTKFEFFHRLVDVGLNEPVEREQYVKALHFHVQAQMLKDRPYDPLVEVKGVPCWPSQPRWAQLQEGSSYRAERRDFESAWDDRHVATKKLVVREDFDFVLLAVGLGEVPRVCRQIVERDTRWQNMVGYLKTVATQALQLWCHHSVEELGWSRGTITMTGFVSPFDTWADMTHLISEEAWPVLGPRSIAYFCNVLSDREIMRAHPNLADHPTRIHEAVWENARTFVRRDLPTLWPRLKGRDDVRWDVLVDHRRLEGRSDTKEPRLKSQFVRANVNPTDRYSLSLPGTPRFRISPLDRTYDNFTIAGDWTDCGFNLGCVEAAVMSGMLAAHALSGSPELAAIVGYDHP